MPFISPKNEYPRHYGDIMNAVPNWQPEDELPNGWVEVALTAQPETVGDEIAYEDFPIEVDGVMSQNWKIRPMTSEEITYRDAPKVAMQKLVDAGLTELEIGELLYSAGRA